MLHIAVSWSLLFGMEWRFAGAAHGHFFGGNIRWAEMPPMGGRLPMGAF